MGKKAKQKTTQEIDAGSKFFPEFNRDAMVKELRNIRGDLNSIQLETVHSQMSGEACEGDRKHAYCASMLLFLGNLPLDDYTKLVNKETTLGDLAKGYVNAREGSTARSIRTQLRTFLPEAFPVEESKFQTYDTDGIVNAVKKVVGPEKIVEESRATFLLKAKRQLGDASYDKRICSVLSSFLEEVLTSPAYEETLNKKESPANLLTEYLKKRNGKEQIRLKSLLSPYWNSAPRDVEAEESPVEVLAQNSNATIRAAGENSSKLPRSKEFSGKVMRWDKKNGRLEIEFLAVNNDIFKYGQKQSLWAKMPVRNKETGEGLLFCSDANATYERDGQFHELTSVTKALEEADARHGEFDRTQKGWQCSVKFQGDGLRDICLSHIRWDYREGLGEDEIHHEPEHLELLEELTIQNTGHSHDDSAGKELRKEYVTKILPKLLDGDHRTESSRPALRRVVTELFNEDSLLQDVHTDIQMNDKRALGHLLTELQGRKQSAGEVVAKLEKMQQLRENARASADSENYRFNLDYRNERRQVEAALYGGRPIARGQAMLLFVEDMIQKKGNESLSEFWQHWKSERNNQNEHPRVRT